MCLSLVQFCILNDQVLRLGTFRELACLSLELAVMMAELNSKNSRLFCEHREENVSKRTYYNHKRLYYDRKSRSWSRTRLFISDANAIHVPQADDKNNSADFAPSSMHYGLDHEEEVYEPGTLFMY